MLFAVEEINNSSTLLPGVSLGYKIYDTCGSMAMAVRVTMALANGHENTSSAGPCTKQAYVQTILGDTTSSACMAMAKTIGPFKLPMVLITEITIILKTSSNMIVLESYFIKILFII